MGASGSKKVCEILPEVFYIESHLNEKEQLKLFKASQELSKNKSAVEIKNTQSNYAEFLSLDLLKNDSFTQNKNKERIDHLLQSVVHLVEKQSFSFPQVKDFTYLTGYHYPKSGKLAGHTDNIPGWLIIVALGSSANFWVQIDGHPRKDVIFKSGDILAFETSIKSAVVHGIDSIIPGTCPKVFPEDYHESRISLQFRQTIATQLVPPPSSSSSSSSSPSSSPPLSLSNLLLNNDNANNNNNINNNNNNIALPPPPLTHPTPDAPFTTLTFYGLIKDTILHIFSFLGHTELTRASATCKTYHQMPELQTIWSQIYKSTLQKEKEERKMKYKKMRENSKSKYFMYIEPEPDYEKFVPTIASITQAKIAKLLYHPIRKETNTNAVTIDLGTYTIKSGMCGFDSPKSVVPNLWGSDSSGIYVGNQCKKRPGLNLNQPIKNRVVEDFNHLKHIWEHVFVEEMKLLPPECYVLAQIGKPYPKKNKEDLTEMAFESMSCGGFYVALNGVLAMYASGMTTGLAIDIGHQSTGLSIVTEGYGGDNFLRYVDIGGYHITQYLKHLAIQRYPDITLSDDDFEEIKKTLCYVQAQPQETEIPSVTYKGYKFDKELVQAAEVIFNPKIWNDTAHLKSIIEAVVSLIMTEIEITDRQQYYSGFNIVGGGAKLKGMKDRIQNELVNAFPKNSKIVVRVPDESYENGPWLGGSILGSLSTFSKMWISKPEYEESGPSIVHRKCF